MKIIIEYEASWRNSFLDGSNNQKLPTKGRSFISSMALLKKPNNYIQRKVTKDTVMGVLNRLIGEQGKLYQARLRPNYYFAEIESILKDNDIIDQPIISNEIVYIRNITGNTDRNSFTGMIKVDDPWLKSVYAKEFWSVLWMNIDELLQFINDNHISTHIEPILNPLQILQRFEEIKKTSTSINTEIQQAAEKLSSRYPKFLLKESNNQIQVLSLYCSALYLKLDLLSEQYDTKSIRAPRGGLTGISHNGFTPKNFMQRFSTGPEKIVWGNPYLSKSKKKGVGEVISMLTKASGQLTINLNISESKATELQDLIDNAGVSTFYLGKKGLAYISQILI
ncbi:type I-Fv CRISPR-associated protein Cas5fv [Ignatzschineria sp. LJL83]